MKLIHSVEKMGGTGRRAWSMGARGHGSMGSVTSCAGLAWGQGSIGHGAGRKQKSESGKQSVSLFLPGNRRMRIFPDLQKQRAIFEFAVYSLH